MRREEKLAIVKEHHLEGEFQLYVEGKEKFEVPLYVVSPFLPPRASHGFAQGLWQSRRSRSDQAIEGWDHQGT